MLIIEFELLILCERCIENQSQPFMSGVGPHTGNKNWKIAFDAGWYIQCLLILLILVCS